MAAYEPNKIYNVRVRFANAIESDAKGTPGIQIGFVKEDGEEITHVIWVTPVTIDFVTRDMAIFGVTNEQLKSPSFMDNLGSMLNGKTCAILTHEEEYRGNYKTKVKAIKRIGDGVMPSHKLAEMFGGPKAVATAAPPPSVEATGVVPSGADQKPIEGEPVDDLPF